MAWYYQVLFLLQFYGKRRSLSRGRLGEAVVIRGYTVFKSIATLFLLILAYVKLDKKTIIFVKFQKKHGTVQNFCQRGFT